MLLVYPLAALIGYAISIPLLAWGHRLLASIGLEPDASPEYAAYGGIAPPLHRSGEGAGGWGLPVAWQWTLRLALAALFPLLAWRVASSPGSHLPLVAQWALLSACAAFLLLAAVIDGATHLIFVEVIAPAAMLVGVVALMEGADVWPTLVVGMLVAGGALLLVYLLGQVCFGMEALGWGDVQLGLVLGALLGWAGALRALVWGLLIMLVVVLALLALRRITVRSFIPLGTFFIAGVLLSFLCTLLPWE